MNNTDSLHAILCIHGKIHLPLYSTFTMSTKKGHMPKIFSDAGQVPFLPASQIKGALRRAAVAYLLARKGLMLETADDYYFNMVGGVKGKNAKPQEVTTEQPQDSGAEGETTDTTAATPKKPKSSKGKKANKDGTDSVAGDEDGEDADETSKQGSALLRLRDYLPHNPVQQLFGSGDLLGSFYPGHLYVTNAIPPAGSVTECLMDGIRTDDARVRPDLMMSTSTREILAEIEHMMEVNKKRTEIKARIGELFKKLIPEARKAKNVEELNKYLLEKSQLDADQTLITNPVSMPWSFPYAAFSKPLPVRLTISRDATLVELGLLLRAMEWQIQNAPYYGAHKTLGFGEFQADYSLDQENHFSLIPFSETHFNGALFQQALDALENAIPDIDLSSPNSVVPKPATSPADKTPASPAA